MLQASADFAPFPYNQGMKRWRKAGAVLLLLIGVLAAIPSVRDHVHWAVVRFQDSATLYERYVQLRPQGAHVGEALRRIDADLWASTRAQDNVLAYERYIGAPGPQGFREAAETQIARLRNDRTAAESLLRSGSRDALKEFLRRTPGHVMESELRSALRRQVEGVPLARAFEESELELELHGFNIHNVVLKARLQSGEPFTLSIPAGTYFVSKTEGVQNMVTTKTSRLELVPGEWASVTIPAACANRTLEVPNDKHRFGLQEVAPTEDLRRLMTVLDQQQHDTAIYQAAVWIVTDDATYDQMGLVGYQERGTGIYRGRMIEPHHAIFGMRACESAGINIRSKKIWADRNRLRLYVVDSEARTWLEERTESWDQVLQAPQGPDRELAILALAKIGDEPSVQLLLKALQDDDPALRTKAAGALSNFPTEDVFQALVRTLQDPEMGPRRKAAAALGVFEDPRAIPHLIAMLEARQPGYASAAYALSFVADERAVMPLIRTLETGDWEVRENAASALGRLRDPRAIDPLIAVVDTNMNSVPERVSEALELITRARDVPAERREFIPYWKSYRARQSPQD